MKKTFFLAAGLVALTCGANAQISVSPEAGINLANMHRTYKDGNGDKQKLDDGIKLGVKVGVNVNLPVSDHLEIQPGIFYSIKGVKSDDQQTSGTITYSDKNNITLHWIDVPVNVQYMFNDPNEGRFFIGVGPYLAVAFAGKNLKSSDLGGVSISSDTTFKFGNDYPSNNLRRFDFGGQVNAGYLLKSGIFFRGMYQQGIPNLTPQGNQDAFAKALEPAIRTTNITISVGYRFGGHDKKSKDKNPGGMNG